MIPSLALYTSHDGAWAVVRDGRRVAWLAKCAGAPVAELALETDDADLALVAPPTALAVLARTPQASTLAVYPAPATRPAARLPLEIPAHLAAVTGPRMALLSPDRRHALIVRSAGHALASQLPELEGPIEFVAGLERNQLLFGLHKKLEAIDAVSCRPLARPLLPLPPPPRVLGSALGHLWAMRQAADRIIVIRLSDHRPFEHDAQSSIVDVICHPSSPVLVLVTATGILRLHCHAHSVTPIRDVPAARGAMALHVDGDEHYLVGTTGIAAEPWRVRVTRPS